MIDIEWLLINGPCRQIQAKQRIFCSGEMYILLSGKVDVFEIKTPKNLTPIGSVLPGESFGKYEFCFGQGNTLYIAGMDSVVYVLSEDSFCALALVKPRMLLEIFKSGHMAAKNAAAPVRAVNTAAKTIPAPKKPPVKPAAVSPPIPAAMATPCPIFPDGHMSYPGVTRPNYAKFVFKKGYSCTFCGKPFDDYKVFQSKLYTSAPPRYDLRRYYADFQIEWFDILTCPHCLFSAYYTCFSEPILLKKAKIEKELADARQTVKLNFKEERNIDYVFTTHYLALLCAKGYISSNERHFKAKIWGNLSWLYEDVENEQMARFASAQAAEAYESLYVNNRLNPIQEQAVSLTIAGMLYRAGKEENLKKYLFAAMTNQMGNREYARMAEDLLEIQREKET